VAIAECGEKDEGERGGKGREKTARRDEKAREKVSSLERQGKGAHCIPSLVHDSYATPAALAPASRRPAIALSPSSKLRSFNRSSLVPARLGEAWWIVAVVRVRRRVAHSRRSWVFKLKRQRVKSNSNRASSPNFPLVLVSPFLFFLFSLYLRRRALFTSFANCHRRRESVHRKERERGNEIDDEEEEEEGRKGGAPTSRNDTRRWTSERVEKVGIRWCDGGVRWN
jgi:hypothetical protein